MTRLAWNTTGQRFYEAGIDRGVLFVNNERGVAWQGLVSVSESPSGAEPKPYYIDAYQYLNLQTSEEFGATISAFTYPDEFEECDGTVSLLNGLFATQQPRRSFGLSYRTRLGNDLDGTDYGYKIHLVYNALASPSGREYSTLSDSQNPLTFSWSVTTRPPRINGYKSTAHFVIDSRRTPHYILTELENVLYGTDQANSRMPTVEELITIFVGTSMDGGIPDSTFTQIYDGGSLNELQTTTVDGGGP